MLRLQIHDIQLYSSRLPLAWQLAYIGMLKFVLLRDIISLESGLGFERTLPRDVISEPVNDQIPEAISINSYHLTYTHL